MRKALTGIFHVLNLKCNDRNDILYHAGIDNIKGLHDNLVKLLKEVYSPKDVRIKLKESALDDYELREILPF
ncbi:MAG: hypothetical protein R6U96_02310 [Promethearchaeia archaeon]